jgi:hypothetical protein
MVIPAGPVVVVDDGVAAVLVGCGYCCDTTGGRALLGGADGGCSGSSGGEEGAGVLGAGCDGAEYASLVC